MGYFTLLAAAMGCRVKAVEPNPYLKKPLRKSIEVNQFKTKIQFYPNVVSTLPSGSKVPFGVYEGHFGLSGVSENASLKIESVRLDEIIYEDVFVLKIDVEGYEIQAIQSAERIFERKRIEHIFVEWDKVALLVRLLNADCKPEAVKILQRLLSLDYEIFELPHESYDEDLPQTDIWMNEARPIPSSNLVLAEKASHLWFRRK